MKDGDEEDNVDNYTNVDYKSEDEEIVNETAKRDIRFFENGTETVDEVTDGTEVVDEDTDVDEADQNAETDSGDSTIDGAEIIVEDTRESAAESNKTQLDYTDVTEINKSTDEEESQKNTTEDGAEEVDEDEVAEDLTVLNDEPEPSPDDDDSSCSRKACGDGDEKEQKYPFEDLTVFRWGSWKLIMGMSLSSPCQAPSSLVCKISLNL